MSIPLKELIVTCYNQLKLLEFMVCECERSYFLVNKIMLEKIPFINLKKQYCDLESDIQARISSVLEHGQYVMGPEVVELEEKLAIYTGARYCITVGSGTDALLISLMALGIKPGDEVITTPFTFIASVEVIVLLGAKPVFVDCEPDTCNLNVELVQAAITEKTIAIMPVSLYGQPSDMSKLNSIASKYNIVVVEDAAQSFGAEYKGNKSCNLSKIGCTSFFPSKPLGCYGDGGAIFTSDKILAKICREIRVHGQQKRYFHTRIGIGGRMDTIQCAILLAKFGSFELEVTQRMKLGEQYNIALDNIGIERVKQKSDRSSVFAQYTIFSDHRDNLRRKLKEAGVPTAVHYPIPVNQQPAYRYLCCPDCTPVASKLAQRVLSIPMSAQLTENEQGRIVDLLFENSHYC